MAQKSKKSKSKRMSLKQKYKIVKKVKEHHKKKAKEDKKSGRSQKAPKDPGIPSAWPFKADLLKELNWEKQRAVAVDKQRKEERKRARVSSLQKTVSRHVSSEQQYTVVLHCTLKDLVNSAHSACDRFRLRQKLVRQMLI